MEKEKVLEIEITKINEMYSCWYVKKVNKIKLKAMPLTEIGTEEKNKLCFGCGYKTNFNKEYIGDEKSHLSYYDYQINLEVDFLEYYEKSIPKFIENKYVGDLKGVIDLVNDLYGIPKRWKPKLEESFFIVERVRTEVSFKWVVTDLVYKNNHWIDFYAINSGNCFKTYEEAEKVVLKLEELEKNFWAKVRAGEIGGDE